MSITKESNFVKTDIHASDSNGIEIIKKTGGNTQMMIEVGKDVASMKTEIEHIKKDINSVSEAIKQHADDDRDDNQKTHNLINDMRLDIGNMKWSFSEFDEQVHTMKSVLSENAAFLDKLRYTAKLFLGIAGFVGSTTLINLIMMWLKK